VWSIAIRSGRVGGSGETMHFSDEPEHITLLRETLRRFVREEMPPEKRQRWDREHRFPPELFEKLASLGVCGLTIAEEYGGVGRDLLAAVAVIEELCRGGAFAAGPFIHCAFYGGVNISENGSEEQKRALLPKLAAGELLFAYGLSEPDVGGDLASVTTTARHSEDGSKLIIDGFKRWCTGAEFADYIYCLVRSETGASRYENLSFVLIPPSTPGVTIHPIDHMNLRYTLSSDVILEGVEVPVENIVGGEARWNQGWRMLAGPALDVEKIEITACTYGIAKAAVEDAWEYAQQRQQFGRPISGHQAVRHTLVDARTRLQACRHMLYHAAWLAQEGRPCSVETSMAKLFVADTAVQIGLACQQVMGAYGLSEGHDMERHVRDLLGMPIVGGSSLMQKNNIANRLGLAS
jgi:alkylation response protein AidB-like acyl-CoA dehydrogenase